MCNAVANDVLSKETVEPETAAVCGVAGKPARLTARQLLQEAQH